MSNLRVTTLSERKMLFSFIFKPVFASFLQNRVLIFRYACARLCIRTTFYRFPIDESNRDVFYFRRIFFALTTT